MEQKELTLNDYQRQAMTTCMTSCDNITYMALNLVGEVGELASKQAKAIRKEEIVIGGEKPNALYVNTDNMTAELLAEFENELKLECGDVLWMTAGLCKVMGWHLNDVAQQNLDKLASRKQRGVIDGNGDDR